MVTYTYTQIIALLNSMTRTIAAVANGTGTIVEMYVNKGICSHSNTDEHQRVTTPAGVGVDTTNYYTYNVNPVTITNVPKRVTHAGGSVSVPFHNTDAIVTGLDLTVSMGSVTFVAPKVDWASESSFQNYVAQFVSDPTRTTNPTYWQYGQKRTPYRKITHLNDFSESKWQY